MSGLRRVIALTKLCTGGTQCVSVSVAGKPGTRMTMAFLLSDIRPNASTIRKTAIYQRILAGICASVPVVFWTAMRGESLAVTVGDSERFRELSEKRIRMRPFADVALVLQSATRLL